MAQHFEYHSELQLAPPFLHCSLSLFYHSLFPMPLSDVIRSSGARDVIGIGTAAEIEALADIL